MCNKHYTRWSKYGDPYVVKNTHKMTTREKLDYYTNKNGICWEWEGGLNDSGYGKLRIGDKDTVAHRVSYTEYIGEIPKGMYVLHNCDNRKCNNPEHLFLGTHQDNMDDMVNKNRQAQGEDVCTAKLTNNEVKYMKMLFKRGVMCKVVAAMFGITLNYASKIKCGRGWGFINV